MFSSQMSHHVLLELHRVREFELLAAAKESSFLKAAKDSEGLGIVDATRPRLLKRSLVGVCRFLMAFGP